MSNLSPDFTHCRLTFALIRRMLDHSGPFYTDSRAFEHEKERIFANSWICVAHGSEVARPNDYITRGSSAKISLSSAAATNILRAFYNVCPPRPPATERRRQSQNVITCPYRLGLQTGRQSRPRPQLRKRGEFR